MRFFWPNILWLCLPIWLILPMIWIVMENRAAKQLSRFASPQLLTLLLRGGTPQQLAGRRRTRFIFGLLALLCTIIAVARPQLGVREETIPSEGLDIVFLLDVSNSMLTEDIVPSRLKKAKHIVRNFIDRLSGDRAGIVAFAGSAYPAVPLTTDYEFLKQTLDVLDESSVANQGTDLAKGLEVSHDLLMRGGVTEDDDAAHQQSESAGSRIIIIVSDGESHEGEEAKLAAKLKERGIRVFTIGVGSIKGGPIPLRDQSGYSRGFKKDSGGNIILTKLESANLEAIASKTDGKYYAASSNEGEVEEILSQLSSMERTQGGGRRVIVYDEIYQYPLAAGVLFLMIMLMLREARAAPSEDDDDTRKSSGSPGDKAVVAQIAIGLLLLGGLPGKSNVAMASSLNEYNSTKKGVEAYEDKDFASAIQHFGKAQASDPESATHHMNLGDAMLKSGSVDGAVSEFNSVMKSKNATEAGRGAYNLGKTYEEAKDFEKAMRSYQAGLDRLAVDPKSDSEVEQRIKRALEQAVQKKQQQQQQQQQQGQNQNPGQGKDDAKEQKDKQNPKYDIPKRKPEFKAERLTEGDAKRLMKQLQEQEKKSQQRVMRAKTGKPKDDKITKDW